MRVFTLMLLIVLSLNAQTFRHWTFDGHLNCVPEEARWPNGEGMEFDSLLSMGSSVKINNDDNVNLGGISVNNYKEFTCIMWYKIASVNTKRVIFDFGDILRVEYHDKSPEILFVIDNRLTEIDPNSVPEHKPNKWIPIVWTRKIGARDSLYLFDTFVGALRASTTKSNKIYLGKELRRIEHVEQDSTDYLWIDDIRFIKGHTPSYNISSLFALHTPKEPPVEIKYTVKQPKTNVNRRVYYDILGKEINSISTWAVICTNGHTRLRSNRTRRSLSSLPH